MYQSFDTHEAFKIIATSGIGEKQAEAIVNVINQGRNTDLNNLATKSDIISLRAEFKTDIADLRTELKTDIADLRTELKTDIADLRTELKTDIANVKSDILKWFIGINLTMLVAITSAFFAIFKYFIH